MSARICIHRELLDPPPVTRTCLISATPVSFISSKLSRAKRALRGNNPDQDKALDNLMQAAEILQSEIDWRQRAGDLATELAEYDAAIANTIGMRMQQRLTGDQAESIATCLAVHKDLTLHF